MREREECAFEIVSRGWCGAPRRSSAQFDCEPGWFSQPDILGESEESNGLPECGDVDLEELSGTKIWSDAAVCYAPYEEDGPVYAVRQHARNALPIVTPIQYLI